MIKKIVTIPNKILRSKSKRIGFVDDSIRQLANDMIATTLKWDHDSEFGAALAAIQVGEPLKLTVVRNDFDNAKSKKFTALVNPEIVKTSTEVVSDIEGCLSVPGIYGRVKRPLKIKVKAQDANGQPIRLSLEGFPARVLLHEIDHMNGIIFLDHIKDSSQLFNIDKNGSLMPITQTKKDAIKKTNHLN
ncbi:peptide deformylase [Candidatus Saccharibacteria bacterium]|nr:peptide deformylase [Candidatus Saccharibacteria bacterium]